MELSLGRGLYALVDDADAPLCAGRRWLARRAANTFYAVCLGRENGRRKLTWLHRLLLDVHDPALEVDHINGNGLDNRRANLRLATRAQNARNHRRSRSNTSGYMGVSRSTGRQRWYVQIRGDGKPVRLGYYQDLADAARAYNEAATHYYGAFARLNEVPPPRPVADQPPPWQGDQAEAALTMAACLGHNLGPPMKVTGVPARQCTVCWGTVVPHKDGSYGGSALREPCALRHQPTLSPHSRHGFARGVGTMQRAQAITQPGKR